MNHETTIKKPINSFNVFPDNRDFFFLDSDEKIKDFKTTNFEDPEYICVISENKEKQIKEGIYKRNDFLKDYEFIKVDDKESRIYINFIISKRRINIGGRETRLLTEIKSRPLLMKEIYRKTKINFNTQENIFFKELYTVPTELKFYNRIFNLLFPNNQNKKNNTVSNNFEGNFNYPINQPINNNFNIHNFGSYIYNNNINNNINYNNNIQVINNNNYNEYKSKEDPKGHTGFL